MLPPPTLRPENVMRSVLVLVLILFSASSVDASELTVPIELHSKRGVVLVDGSVAGRAVSFIVDTGATTSLVDSELVGNAFEKRASKFRTDAPGIEVRGKVEQAEIVIEGIGAERRIVAAVDFTEIRRVYGDSVRAILGQDFLRRYSRVTFDYAERKMVLTR
jgi:predicted aspartyl protease